MIKENLASVRENIVRAAKNRPAAFGPDVTLVAVTKNHTVEEMREAIDAGATIIGENRVQEAMQKKALLERNVKWHLIGHLQTNKVKHAVTLFDMIESVDSEKLACAINKEAEKIGKIQDVLVQVNLVKEESKTGVYLEDLDPLLKAVDQMEHLNLRGLMFIAPNLEAEKVRPLFEKMRALFERTQKSCLPNSKIELLSMGMTHDYEIAITAGANVVRVGTAIFGPRQY